MSQAKNKVVVVGVDFQTCSDEAVLTALHMLNDGSARSVHLLHVLDPRDVIVTSDTPRLITEEAVLEQAPDLVRQRVHSLGDLHGIPVPVERVFTHARIGRAAETLMQMTVDYEADLLIVGTHGRRGIARLSLGSVAEKLVREARCPVLVARETSYAGAPKTERPARPPAPGEAVLHECPRDLTERVRSTESDNWNPAHSAPTGLRIV